MTWDLKDIIAVMLVFIRASAFFLSLPVFAGRVVPRQVRIAFAFIISVIVTPLIPMDFQAPQKFVDFVFLGLEELFLGALMGFAVRMIFFIVEFAGQLISNEIGFTMSSEFNPMADNSASGISNMLFYLAIIIFFVCDFQYMMLSAFVKSFSVVGFGVNLIGHWSALYFVKTTSNIFLIGLQMAAPVMAINFLVNVIFSVLGKIVPRMNVFVLSFSTRILAGLVVFLASLLLIVKYITSYMSGLGENMLQFIIY